MELIDRYVYAVAKKLPYKLRNDVEKELRTLIADMLEERTGELAPTEQDVRVVLAELGTPRSLAEKYNPQGERALIGPAYYGTYRMVLTIVLACITGGMALAHVLMGGFEPAPWYQWALNFLGSWVPSLFFAFTFVTLFFAAFERAGISVQTDSLDDLPPAPDLKERVGLGETVFGVALSVVFAMVFLFAPQILGWYIGPDGAWAPLFNSEVIRGMWWAVLLLTLLGTGATVFNFIEGSRTMRACFVTITTDLISIPLTLALFLRPGLINPAFLDGIRPFFGEDAEIIHSLFANFGAFLAVIIVFALLLEIGTTIPKLVRLHNAK